MAKRLDREELYQLYSNWEDKQNEINNLNVEADRIESQLKAQGIDPDEPPDWMFESEEDEDE